MKKNKIIIVILILVVINNKANADNSMHLGFFGGLAIPNEKVSQFYDDAKKGIQLDTITWGKYFLEKAANIGYNLKMQGRIELTNNFIFVPSIGICRFSEGIYDLIVPFSNNDTAIATTQSTANIIPISVGINTYLFKKFLSPYINADLVYNYMSYSYDIVWNKNFALPIATSTTMHRLGYGIGAGLDINLSLISLNFETKFNVANIIKYDDEPPKNYFTFLLGIIF